MGLKLFLGDFSLMSYICRINVKYPFNGLEENRDSDFGDFHSSTQLKQIMYVLLYSIQCYIFASVILIVDKNMQNAEEPKQQNIMTFL